MSRDWGALAAATLTIGICLPNVVIIDPWSTLPKPRPQISLISLLLYDNSYYCTAFTKSTIVTINVADMKQTQMPHCDRLAAVYHRCFLGLHSTGLGSPVFHRRRDLRWASM